MGAWTFVLTELKNFNIEVIAREASAATATGSSKISALEQNKLIDKLFKKKNKDVVRNESSKSWGINLRS